MVPCFETLMGVNTIPEATRNVISCPFRVNSWIVLAQGKTTRNQTRALPTLLNAKGAEAFAKVRKEDVSLRSFANNFVSFALELLLK